MPEPQIIEIGMRVRVIIYLSQSLPLVNLPPDEIMVSQERLESRLAAKVLIHLKQGDAGKMELAKALGHKTVSGELHKQIKILLSQQLIEMTIPNKPNSRMQKYRLTDIGREIFSNESGN